MEEPSYNKPAPQPGGEEYNPIITEVKFGAGRKKLIKWAIIILIGYIVLTLASNSVGINITLYKSGIPIVSPFAARNLGEIGDKRAIKPLLNIVRRGEIKYIEDILWELDHSKESEWIKNLKLFLINNERKILKETIMALIRLGSTCPEESTRGEEYTQESITRLITSELTNFSELDDMLIDSSEEINRDDILMECLTETLRDEDSDVRIISARLLAKIGDDATKELLIFALRDSDPRVAEHIRKVFDGFVTRGWFGGTFWPQPLPGAEMKAEMDFYSEPDRILRKSLWKLLITIGDLYKVKDFSNTKKNLKAKDPQARFDAVLSLQEYLHRRTHRDVYRVLLFTLLDDDPRVRGISASTLGLTGKEELVGFLIDALYDEDAGVRESAATALGQIGMAHKESLQHLLPFITEKNEEPEVIKAAFLNYLRVSASYHTNEKWVGEFETAYNNIKSLALNLKSDEYKNLHPIYIEALYEAQNEWGSNINSFAAIIQGELGYPDAVPHLISALKKEHVAISEIKYIFEALGKIGDARAVETLIPFLNHQNNGVRIEAERTLNKITGEDLGKDDQAWQKWWEENKNRYLEPE